MPATHRIPAWRVAGALLLTSCISVHSVVLPPVSNVVDLDGYRGLEGFGALKWGMTLDEARALLPNAEVQDHVVLRQEELVAERPTVVRYLFVDGRLARVLVAYTPQGAPAAEFVRADLRRRFGAPSAAHAPTATPEPRKHPRAHKESDDLELFLAMFLLGGTVAGIAAAHGGGSSSNWGSFGLSGGPASWNPEPGHARPRLSPAGVHPADLDAAASPDKNLGELLGAPPEELAYARWMTRESVVEWAAHEWAPELLLTSFSSRVLLQPR
jgi:hypothetical protein